MANAAIITVGNELLNGHKLDTNSQWLSSKLLNISTPVVYSCCVGDVIEDIKDAIEYACKKADIILITGGLGPTDDDLTRDALAKFLDVDLEFHSQIEDKLQQYFQKINRPMSPRNRVQAYLPQGTTQIENSLGTAPGIFYSDDKKIIAAMPGVPSEMKQMFKEHLLGKIKKLSVSQYVVIKKLKCIGVGESALADMLGDLMNRQSNPLINCTVSAGVITLHIIARDKDKKTAELMAEKQAAKLSKILGDLVYANGDKTLAEVVVEKLKAEKKTLVAVESCTAGLISKMITDISGASEIFKQGWVTYSNQSKISAVGVKAELIDRFGAVSAEVAEAMAEGAKKESGADFAVAVTGIAGPTGGTEQKPVGLVYIAISSEKGVFVNKFLFGQRNRAFIRLRTAQNALNLLRLNFGV